MPDNINSHNESAKDNKVNCYGRRFTMSSISFVLFGFVLVLSENFGSCNVLRETVSDDIEKRSITIPVSYDTMG